MPTSSPNHSTTPSVPPNKRGGRRSVWWAWALLVIGALIVAYPFLPAAQYAVAKPDLVIPYQTKLSSLPSVPDVPKTNTPVTMPKVAAKPKPTPVDNRVVIPKIGVDMPIVEGPNESALNRGLWHIPGTSSPDAGSNTVLSGHRWQYLPPSRATLYLLDKLKSGDVIIIYWKGKEYDYAVTKTLVVDPNQTAIQNPTDTPRLTIYTCTPLYSTKHRLVVYAEPIS